jgi:phenylalanyl-tRNA synthetase beta chain
VTNYVMLALGNPLHAFDQAKLRGGIVVRRARPGEKLRTLDGVDRELTPDDLLIADHERAVALAGIMGGEETEISGATTDVLLEAANFEPYGLFRTSERLRLRTEGSNRWEKGVDPYLAGPAADLATKLLVELADARWVGATDVEGTLPARPVVRYRPERADEVNGLETPAAEQHAILERLGFDREDGSVVVPTWRARDVRREIDVVEEISRYRLDDVPFTLPLRRAMFGSLTRAQQLRRRIEDALAGLGYAETYTPSLRLDDPDPAALRLPEPISAELGTLRTTLVPSLVDAVRRNIDAGAEAIALYEIAHVYLPADGLPEEPERVAGIVEGDFFRVKGAVEALYRALKAEPSFEPDRHELLHPGKAARLAEGWVGELHPALLDGTWGVFELDVGGLVAASREPVAYQDVLSFPAIRQDLAFAVPEDVPAGKLVLTIREAAGPELREVRVFDVYRGEQVGERRKSVALRVAFQADDRTLTDEDAALLRERIVAAVAGQLGGELRA